MTGDVVTLRQRPGTRYAAVSQVGEGELLCIVGRNEDGDWWQVEWGEDKVGWITSGYVDWRYDGASGRYLRSVCGVAHVDAGTGQQLSAAQVIVFYAHQEPTDMVEDALGAKAIRIALRGSGPVKLLRDGVVVEDTWRAEHPNQPPHFFDAGGREIPLKPGDTWVQAAPEGYHVCVE